MDWKDERAFLYKEVERLIKDTEIKQFVLAALDNAPDYIWQINASTSGTKHNGETQTHHVLMALKVAENISDILRHPNTKRLTHSGDKEIDILYAAVTLHDLFKCGKPGQENKINGEFRTDHLHPFYVAEMTKNIQVYSQGEEKNVQAHELSWWNHFVHAVTGHSGPWTPYGADLEFLFDFGNLTMLTFLCDYFASRKGIAIEI